MHYELMLAARKAVSIEYQHNYSIAYENVVFTPPDNGDMWLKFDYVEVSSDYLSLDRMCRSYIGMVQIGVICQPGGGTDRMRMLAKEIADFFYDGKMLEHGYIYEGGEVKPIQKSETGWLVPVRFYVRFDERRNKNASS